ncbi:hypothetical protein [Amylibacter sp. IMCC11727]|uniref:hypothetical protein n=1 Tax=Amylibacter sp. IMCC11727 TaxID=3039851 RepID=UPI00244DAEB7|nr:hypothetical protein [Amylibacter sp. IMCC11727]WGI20218.1 hypothetical protein QBD29_08770 [Amylibacter sp. IMCC11727]
MSVTRPSGVPFSDKIKFGWAAVARHGMLWGIFGTFMAAGALVVWAAPVLDDAWFVYAFGWLFILFPLGMMVWTMPSSLMFYYEKQVVKKYGRSAEAVVTDIYDEVLDENVTLYYVEYEFTYKSAQHSGKFYVDEHKLVARMRVGDNVPIKFLAFDPSQSDVRMRSLKGKYK